MSTVWDKYGFPRPETNSWLTVFLRNQLKPFFQNETTKASDDEENENCLEPPQDVNSRLEQMSAFFDKKFQFLFGIRNLRNGSSENCESSVEFIDIADTDDDESDGTIELEGECQLVPIQDSDTEIELESPVRRSPSANTEREAPNESKEYSSPPPTPTQSSSSMLPTQLSMDPSVRGRIDGDHHDWKTLWNPSPPQSNSVIASTRQIGDEIEKPKERLRDPRLKRIEAATRTGSEAQNDFRAHHFDDEPVAVDESNVDDNTLRQTSPHCHGNRHKDELVNHHLANLPQPVPSWGKVNEQVRQHSSQNFHCDLRRAYEDYLQVKPLQPRTETESKPNFWSSDPQENRDNSPTRWAKVRRLKTDEERVQFAMDQFANSEPADPTDNLTFHAFLRRDKPRSDQNIKELTPSQILRRLRIENGRLQLINTGPLSNANRKCKAVGRHCGPVLPFTDFEYQLVCCLARLKFPTLLPRCVNAQQGGRYERPCSNQNICHRCRWKQELNWKFYLKHFKAGVKDSKNFLRFYLDQGQLRDGQLMLPKHFLELALNMEEVFYLHSQIYGPNPESFCKDCSHSHIF